MSEPFIGEIRIFPYTYAPRGWAWCNGSLLPISQYQALYAIIGTFYGGNGYTTVGLPNLQGRSPMHWGDGTGLTPRYIGASSGYSSVTLIESNMPSHDHTARAVQALPNENNPGLTSYPAAILKGEGSTRTTAKAFSDPDANAVQMSVSAMTYTGASQAHINYQPFLGLNFCIALEGMWPSRS